jgi:hypothetical protein
MIELLRREDIVSSAVESVSLTGCTLIKPGLSIGRRLSAARACTFANPFCLPAFRRLNSVRTLHLLQFSPPVLLPPALVLRRLKGNPEKWLFCWVARVLMGHRGINRSQSSTATVQPTPGSARRSGVNPQRHECQPSLPDPRRKGIPFGPFLRHLGHTAIGVSRSAHIPACKRSWLDAAYRLLREKWWRCCGTRTRKRAERLCVPVVSPLFQFGCSILEKPCAVVLVNRT